MRAGPNFGDIPCIFPVIREFNHPRGVRCGLAAQPLKSLSLPANLTPDIQPRRNNRPTLPHKSRHTNRPHPALRCSLHLRFFTPLSVKMPIGWYGPDQNAGLVGAIVGAVLILLVWGFGDRSRRA